MTDKPTCEWVDPMTESESTLAELIGEAAVIRESIEAYMVKASKIRPSNVEYDRLAFLGLKDSEIFTQEWIDSLAYEMGRLQDERGIEPFSTYAKPVTE